MPTAEGAAGPADGEGGRAQAKAKQPVSPKAITGLLIGAVALWFILANTQTARIHMFLVTVSSPMWVVLLLTLVVGGLIGILYLGRRGKKQQ